MNAFKKSLTLLLIIVALLATVAQAYAQEPATWQLSEHFTYEASELSIYYPDGWYVYDEGELIRITEDESMQGTQIVIESTLITNYVDFSTVYYEYAISELSAMEYLHPDLMDISIMGQDAVTFAGINHEGKHLVMTLMMIDGRMHKFSLETQDYSTYVQLVENWASMLRAMHT